MPPSRSKPIPTPPTALPGISDAEWIVMQEFWKRREATVSDIVEALKDRALWKPRTVQSLINRLVQKGALGFTKVNRGHVYHPLVAEGECVLEASRSFVDRIFGGRLAPLLACFVENGKVNKDELAQLRKILEEGNR